MKISDVVENKIIDRVFCITKNIPYHSDKARRNKNRFYAIRTYAEDGHKSIYKASITTPEKGNFVVALEDGETYPLFCKGGCISEIEHLFYMFGFHKVYAYWMPKNYENWSKTWRNKIKYYAT